jgi:serine/threonine-protein kinase
LIDHPFADRPDLAPADYLSRVGTVFTRFDSRTQDSGNVSFGVEAGGRRWFVKSAGDPRDTAPFLSHAARIALLENAQTLARSVRSPVLPALAGAVQSGWGPMLVYEWVTGELVHAPAERRDDPASAFRRFRSLPPAEAAAAIDAILDAHVELCGAGWIAGDFYDGSIIYDFEARRLRLIDLDSYHRGPTVNEMGRMFGSTRFMAPEEFERGAVIDERTTVFNLGRAMAEYLGDGGLARAGFRGETHQYAAMARACAAAPAERFATVAELARAWRGEAATAP